ESTLLSHLVLDLTASCFDSRARTLGGGDTLQGDSATNLARQHDLHTLYVLVDDVGILQRLQGHDVAFHLGQLGSAHFSTIHGLQGYEAELRQTTVQRLLTTLEAGGDAAAGTGSLTLVAAATGLAQTATDTTAGTMLLAACTRCGAQVIQSHG